MNAVEWNCFCPFCPNAEERIGTDPMLLAAALAVHVKNEHPKKALTPFEARQLVKVVAAIGDRGTSEPATAGKPKEPRSPIAATTTEHGDIKCPDSKKK